MREQIEQLLGQVGERLIRFSDWLMVQMQRLLILMQRFWAWYQSIDWPEIPLTPLQWVLLFYGIFGMIYVWATPIFEASDELWHFGAIETIRETGELPQYDLSDPEMLYENNRDTIFRQEGSQPPLYYYLAAAITSPIDISDAETYREPNPHAQAGVPGNYGNKNLVLHDVERPPLQGTPLAVYVIRVAGLLMGVVTIWTVYRAGQLIAPHRPVAGLVAAVLTAFNPMYIFISGSVNNDTLVTMLNALAILLMLYTLRDGFEIKRSLAIAVLVGLGALTKLSALVLVPVIAIAALWLANRDKDWRGLIILGAAMFTVWAVVAGWWYVRNITLYGELFGTATMAAVAGVRTEPFTLVSILNEFQGFRLSYWGVFGAFNIQTTSLFYALVDFVVFMSLFGVAFLIAQLIAIRDFSYARRELTHLLFLLGILLVGLIAFLNWTAQTYATQGRLLFPFMGAISPLLAVGFIEVIWWMLFLLSPPDRSFVRAGEAVPEDVLRQSLRWPIRLIGLFALLIPFLTIMPQYAPPAPLDAIPDDIKRVYARYENVELVGYDHVDRRYVPGERVRMTFYWRVLEQTEEDQSIALVLLNPFGDPHGSIDTFPGAGTLRTSQWEPGKIYADSYDVTLTRAITGRYPFSVQVIWYEGEPDERLNAVDAEGDPMETVLLDIGAVIATSARGDAPGLQLTSLAELEYDATDREYLPGIRLEQFGYLESEDGDDLTVLLQWEATNNIDKSYTAFVHVINESGELVGQYDTQPLLPTRYWRFGETFVTEHPINFIDNNLPAGEYRIVVGWYENNGEDLPRLLINQGQEGETDSFELPPFQITADGFDLPVFAQDEEATEEPLAVPVPGEGDVTDEAEVPQGDDTSEAREPSPEPSDEVTEALATEEAPALEAEATSEVTAEATQDPAGVRDLE